MHASCLGAWLQHSRAGSFTCPLCRASLDIPPAQQPTQQARQARQQQLVPWQRRQVLRSVLPQPVRQLPQEQDAEGLQSSACYTNNNDGLPAASGKEAPAGVQASDGPSRPRPFTRLQARLAAAEAASAAGGASVASSTAAQAAPAGPARRGRAPRRIDAMLD